MIIGKTRLVVGAATGMLCAALVGFGMPRETKAQSPGSPIRISPNLPADLNPGGGGAPGATLAQAANFAWQEFIALNWPAEALQGGGIVRGAPGGDCPFGSGSGSPDCGTRPLVWETIRGKAEIFGPGALTQQYGQPPQYDPSSTNEGVYSQPVPACAATSDVVVRPAWVNLDETSEIDLDSMYSGVNQSGASIVNSDPQLIRFAAKANQAEFDYVNLTPPKPPPLPKVRRSLPTGPGARLTLPPDTLELKTGWRPLTANEAASGHFHTARVRYYEPALVTPKPNLQRAPVCWREAVWGMVALHIIRKTPTAPYFIFATFEQADNILNAAGQPSEDAEGRRTAAPVAPGNTTPGTITHDPSPVVGLDQPNVMLSPANADYCPVGTNGRPVNRLYYRNEADTPAVPNKGPICINVRAHPIPPVIVTANQQAHDAIKAYNGKYGVSSPWQFYKLINVQYKPMTKAAPGVAYSGPDAATYYLSNSVVETNTVLQNFSGGLVRDKNGKETGASSDFAVHYIPGGQPTPPPVPGLFYNVQAPIPGTSGHFNMGGCMGCHGNAQLARADFSFILLFGLKYPGSYPDSVPHYTPAGVQLLAPRFRAINGPPGGIPRSAAVRKSQASLPPGKR